ncbi:hypothetical protein QRD43_02200 [Pelomonas sp. APW6]|uniref:Uncharacterized protein n=1 Tax=Roseateles subflavus TaxID=3053353 RepID=A0ABT7LCW9_9BURK|nr:hypothetical protein [Pelomonas sp. APW6]MDL5030704.1 hypothetical protein [Pelomonas sp. APW6]
MKTIAALMSAACLCAPVAAQVQTQSATTPATASKTLSSSAAQPGGKPTRIAGAPGANLQALSGDSEGCPRGPNGEEECTVEVSGSSNRGGSGGGSLGSGGGGLGGPQTCGSRKVLQAQECTPDTPGGTGKGPDPEEEARRTKKLIDCIDKHSERQKNIEDDYKSELAICAGSTSIGAGGISLPLNWVDEGLGMIGYSCRQRAEKRQREKTQDSNARFLTCKEDALGG